jgi:hypothetical protein
MLKDALSCSALKKGFKAKLDKRDSKHSKSSNA